MVTVNEAIRKGHRMVTYPGIAIMIALIMCFYFLDKLKISPPRVLLVGIAFSFLFSWLYWSFMITKWRLWAFKNVEKPKELKTRAIQEYLIWKDGSVFERTEIRSNAEKEEWKMIQKRINRPEDFN